MNILVTGSMGGFGRFFAGWALQHFTEDVMLTGRTHMIRECYVQCDLERPEEIRSLITRVRPQLIFHLAGSFANDYARDFAINTQSAKHIFDALLAEVIPARVVLFGSAAEYGVVAPEENPVCEDRVLRPVSVYGLTKAYQTQLAYFYAHHYGVDVVVARIFNLLMSGLSERLFVGRVERMIERFKKGEIDTIEVGNLESKRDYVTGNESIRLIELIANYGQPGEVYHVGSGRPIRMRDLLDRMLREASLDWSAVSVAERGGNRVGYDVPLIYADMSKTGIFSEG